MATKLSAADIIKLSEAYLKEEKWPAPREYRTMILGISKHLLSTWKKTQPDLFNLIKSYEDKILAFIEKQALYGSGKDAVGKIFVLRAYDREHYIPEISMRQEVIEDNEVKAPIQLVLGQKKGKGHNSIKETIKGQANEK